jgi:poly(hydroxyalkanoate) depolymerase family esterase
MATRRASSLSLLSSFFGATRHITRAPRPKFIKTFQQLLRKATPPAAKERPAAGRGKMARRFLQWEGGRRAYWLYEPEFQAGSPLPLVVMLHGCQQDAKDFAQGSHMNKLAEHYGFAVAYAEQTQRANRMRCWNWFARHHQGQCGESAMISALALDAARKAGADASCIYLAGMSAGGAMALVAAHAYPDVFAAVACHSGVPLGAASNAYEALRVMRHGPSGAVSTPSVFVPTIVFHGSDDTLVHPANAARIVDAALRAASKSTGGQLVPLPWPAQAGASGSNEVTVSRWVDRQGRVQVESWSIGDMGHAWAGGSDAGKFTARSPVDASEAMVAFFLSHRRSPR